MNDKMKLRQKLPLLLLLFMHSFIVSIDASPASFFKQARCLQSENKLRSPDDVSAFLNLNADTSNLQNLKDADLSGQGRKQVNSSEIGKLLQKSEENKINAVQEYDIGPDNPMLKNAYEIEENPMARTGGRDLRTSEAIIEEQVQKSCVEGAEFDIDVGYELVFECEEEEYLSPFRYEERSVDIPGNDIYHGAQHLGYSIKWKKKRHGWHIHQNSGEWRKYLSGYLNIPLDSIDETISFPNGDRGFGPTHPVYDRWRIVFNKYRFNYTYRWKDKLKRFKEKGEYWQVSTPSTEALTESNECYETSRTCLKSGVKTFFGKYDVSRPCWYEKVTYHCSSEPKGACAHLKRQGCELTNSECEHKIGNICFRWKRNYQCRGQKKQLRFSLADSPIHCLGGDCYSPTLVENKDFTNVAYLAALNEANKDCTKENLGGSGGVCKNPITIFPGEASNCKKIITGCINCCESMKGWGKNVNLSKCSGLEKGLALRKDRGLCHRVGTYCSNKVFGKCIEKKTSYCCFNSKLARIFHEQGRQQLGISWGSLENPNCASLTLDQLSRVDISKFDLEELFDELLTKGRGKQNKSFPTLKPGQTPDIQKRKSEGGL